MLISFLKELNFPNDRQSIAQLDKSPNPNLASSPVPKVRSYTPWDIFGKGGWTTVPWIV